MNYQVFFTIQGSSRRMAGIVHNTEGDDCIHALYLVGLGETRHPVSLTHSESTDRLAWRMFV